MTSLPTQFADIAAAAQRVKIRAVRRGESFPHLLDVERDGRRLLRVGCCSTSDKFLAVIAAAIPVAAADAVTIAMDVWGSPRAVGAAATNPITGKPWELGDMDRMARMDAGVERGLLVESIHLMRYERSGDWTGGSLAYIHDRDTDALVWGDHTFWNGPQVEEQAATMGMTQTGRFPSVLAKAFAERPAIDILGRPAKPHERKLVAQAQRQFDRGLADEIDADDELVLFEARL
jgi:hypothetical protein